MPRPRAIGWVALLVSIGLAALFVYGLVNIRGDSIQLNGINLQGVNCITYCALAAPISLVAIAVLGTGFWIGWTILIIKVVPPMPEIVEKKDYSKIKALILCCATLALGGLYGYGLYVRSFWALAVPAAAVTIVVLGAVFWVGVAIITTRTTLPKDPKQQ